MTIANHGPSSVAVKIAVLQTLVTQLIEEVQRLTIKVEALSTMPRVTPDQCAFRHDHTIERVDDIEQHIDNWRGSLKIIVPVATALMGSTISMLVAHIWGRVP